jgi:hypothetical protein
VGLCIAPSVTDKRFVNDIPSAIVAIPAKNEAERIFACLAALATQRDRRGAPIPENCFEILVFANGCNDATAEVAEACAGACPYPIIVMQENPSAEVSSAGWARKRALDSAADHLRRASRGDALLLTTDADSCVSPTWIDETLRAFAEGVDCVAGYVDAHPAEIFGLGPRFLRRARLEDEYLRIIAEIYAICDPRSHDPWPNHRVSSGASLAVALRAYDAVGGLPERPLGEDVALTHALECAGFKVRHTMAVQAYTSCRFDGRARGGAADTMRHRHAVDDAPCDDDVEPAFQAARRALCKGALRRLCARGLLHADDLSPWLGTSLRAERETLSRLGSEGRFEEFWTRFVSASPSLNRCIVLRPADLPWQIERGRMILRRLRSQKPSTRPKTRSRLAQTDASTPVA